MAKRKTLDEKMAEDLEKYNNDIKELEEIANIPYINTKEELLDLPTPEVNIWADLTIADEEPKENEDAAELNPIDDNFSSVSLESVDESPKPTTYKINEDKDTGLNNSVVTAPIQRIKPQSKNAVRGVYYLNGKIGRN